jgi:hypothetical protein
MEPHAEQCIPFMAWSTSLTLIPDSVHEEILHSESGKDHGQECNNAENFMETKEALSLKKWKMKHLLRYKIINIDIQSMPMGYLYHVRSLVYKCVPVG